MKTVSAAAEEEAVALINLVIDTRECEPSAVMPLEWPRCDRRDHRRGTVLPGVFPGNEKMSAPAQTNRAAERG